MRIWILLAALFLAACSVTTLPEPQQISALADGGRWFKLEKNTADGSTQTSLLAVAPVAGGLRFVQTDALGAPLSRQIVSGKGWRNDGFVPPNAESRRLFAAILPLLAADGDTALYPDVDKVPSAQGALFRYRGQEVWQIAARGQDFEITFPDRSRWLVQPLENDANHEQ
ncbi:hypothetical protein [Bergeriella denitrificans]|uniref:Lipoprotein n=1 Tax=Bergeriella denitrificans TaxID=494 RepID=A0A378UG34_BERDE|nr:hypothetical protein [Bergeriella denitrificans]STZ75713.1 Uncharacterised protein [Bergeriella denitrificans]